MVQWNSMPTLSLQRRSTRPARLSYIFCGRAIFTVLFRADAALSTLAKSYVIEPWMRCSSQHVHTHMQARPLLLSRVKVTFLERNRRSRSCLP